MIKYSERELVLIWLDSFIGLEYKHKQSLFGMIDGVSGIKSLLEKGKDYIVQAVGEKEFATILASANKEYLDFVLDNLDKKGITAVTLFSDLYPSELKQIPMPPVVLYCKGDTSLLTKEKFAIVGSRKSLPLSISIAKDYAKEISTHFCLCTGIAEGVDSAVIQTALDCDCKVISVIAGGFDNVYPKSNQSLFEKVAERGLVISENPPEVYPKPYMFPIRNRIIAGLSKGVLIVSGGIKSGTLYTAEYAEEYGKDLFAVPYSVGIQSGAGCNDLIKRGAMLTDSVIDVLDFYGLQTKEAPQEFTPQERDVLYALKDGQKHINKLCLELNKKAFELLPIISGLEIKGYLVKSGNVYGLCRSVSEE